MPQRTHRLQLQHGPFPESLGISHISHCGDKIRQKVFQKRQVPVDSQFESRAHYAEEGVRPLVTLHPPPGSKERTQCLRVLSLIPRPILPSGARWPVLRAGASDLCSASLEMPQQIILEVFPQGDSNTIEMTRFKF